MSIGYPEAICMARIPLVHREEERHRALGRDATFPWPRALTNPSRFNRTRHRGHL